jgi:hypothetical protein
MSQTREDTAAPPERLRLAVSTFDAQSEILVLDGRGRFVDRGFGPEHAFELEPGMYRVKVLTGTEADEKPVVLTERPREVRFGAAAFASAAPLLGTTTSHEYHTDAAQRETRNTHVHDGDGSSLFFLVRDWTPNAPQRKPQRVTQNPAEGLSLFAVGESGDRKVCDLASAGVSNLDLDAWGACTIDVAPGVYELRLEMPTGETLHQSFVASPGWQTQAFVFLRAYPSSDGPERRVWRADLSRTSLLLSPTKSFSPGEPLLRLAELARVALATKRPNERGDQNRRLLPDQMRALLRGKCDNPILGIYAAHLLLMEASVDMPLVREVVVHLRDLLRAPHPDVEALALRAEIGAPPAPFSDPPMLRRSWSLIVEASIARPELVTESLARRLTGEFWSEGPWHIWKSAANRADSAHPAGLSDVEAALLGDLGVLKQMRVRQTDAGNGDVARAMDPRLYVVAVDLDGDRLNALARRFSLPPTEVRRVLGVLEEKTTRSADIADIKLRFTP